MTLGTAVIGLGNYGQLHARTLAATPGSKLIAVCDSRAERAGGLGAELGCDAVTDLDTILADDRIDFVSVALPDHLHTEVAISVLRSGKHALVQKPMATTAAECESMIRAADEHGVRLMVDFAQRWSPHMQQAKGALDSGALGEPQYVYYRANDTVGVPTSMLAWGGDSSVAWFLASHCLDNLLWLLGSRSAYAGGAGDRLERVRTLTRSRVLAAQGYSTPDFYVSTLEWSSGLVVTLENSWILPDSSPSVADLKIQIVGSTGALSVDGTHHGMIELWGDRAQYLDATAYLDVFGQPSGFVTQSVRHFVHACAQGDVPLVDGRDGLAVTRVIEAMEQSAREDRHVVLDGDLYA